MDSTVFIRQAEVAGSIVDVFCDRSIVAMAPELPMRQADIVLEADGAALLPGLHDHHLHFFYDSLTSCKARKNGRQCTTYFSNIPG